MDDSLADTRDEILSLLAATSATDLEETAITIGRVISDYLSERQVTIDGGDPTVDEADIDPGDLDEFMNIVQDTIRRRIM